VNGEVSLNGDNVSFSSTGISGFPAEFDYTVTNTDGVEGTGKVYVNITPLPPIEALIYATDADVQTTIDNGYTPPTVADIFIPEDEARLSDSIISLCPTPLLIFFNIKLLPVSIP
jgi:hypothetical protein